MIFFCVRFVDFIEEEIVDEFTRLSFEMMDLLSCILFLWYLLFLRIAKPFEDEIEGIDEIVQSFLNPSPDDSCEDPSVLLSFSNTSLFIFSVFALIFNLVKL